MNDPAAARDSEDAELSALEAKINGLLPPRYVGRFEEVAPTSMGSAPLRYDSQGRVAWGEIWTTFCHLALAGGPPHRGRFLGPVSPAEVRAAPEPYDAVVAELRRALRLCVDLKQSPEPPPGWIGLQCDNAAAASWLVRAIIAENVIARHEGPILFVPAGPAFRIEKEVKNVVVSVAKTCHYLLDHLDPEQQPTEEPRRLIRSPLPDEIAASPERYERAAASLLREVGLAVGLPTRLGEIPGWIGVDCPGEDAAVWLLRAVAANDVLVRREDSTLYVPVDIRTVSNDTASNDTESNGTGADLPLAATVAAVARAWRLWRHATRKK